jgi:hypothetical protein
MKSKPIYVETDIRTDLDTLWHFTQTPELHEQWDLRFSSIHCLPRGQDDPTQRFLYRTRIGFGLAIEGTGEATQAVAAGTGERASALVFRSDQAVSLIREGRGYWKYTVQNDKVNFKTQFDYETRFGWLGRWFDRLLFRPLFGWATAWSFDSLRIWLERGIPPSTMRKQAVVHYVSVLMLSLLWFWQGVVPKWLYPEAGEIELLRQTVEKIAAWSRIFAADHLQTGSPSDRFAEAGHLLLAWLGAAEIGVGVLNLLMHRKPWLYPMQIAVLALLAAAAVAGTPELLAAPYNPVIISVAMIGFCGLARVTLRDLPRAGRCLRTPGGSKEG